MKKKAKKRNYAATDSTLINIRSLKKRLAMMEAKLRVHDLGLQRAFAHIEFIYQRCGFIWGGK